MSEGTVKRAAKPADELAELFAATRVLARKLAEAGTTGAVTVDRRRLLRLARGLVRVAEAGDPSFLGFTAWAEAQRDFDARAAMLALLAVATAREITTSRRALVRLALTVLVAELGAPHPGGDELAESREIARLVPAATAAAVIGTFSADPPALLLADLALEAAWMRRQRALGPIEKRHDGSPTVLAHGPVEPRVAARILHVVRALLDRVAPPDGDEPRSPLEALLEVSALRSIDPAVFRCLVRALGVTPAGAIVELASGEWAVVLPPATAVDPLDRPRLRLLTDAAGHPRRPPVDIDLADPAHQGRRIAKLVSPAAASGYVLAAFLPE